MQNMFDHSLSEGNKNQKKDIRDLRESGLVS